MGDMWVEVLRHLTPREARHLIAAVRGLKAEMCMLPTMYGVYLRDVGALESPCVAMQRDVEKLVRNYPCRMLMPTDFACIVEIDCLGHASGERSFLGVTVKFAESGIVYTYDFKVEQT